jgi:extracellular matrix regulatory protein A
MEQAGQERLLVAARRQHKYSKNGLLPQGAVLLGCSSESGQGCLVTRGRPHVELHPFPHRREVAVNTELVHVGFGGIVAANRIVAIVSPDTAPVRRLVQDAKQRQMAIDMTYGRKTKAVIILDSGHVAMSAIQPETIVNRLESARGRQRD